MANGTVCEMLCMCEPWAVTLRLMLYFVCEGIIQMYAMVYFCVRGFFFFLHSHCEKNVLWIENWINYEKSGSTNVYFYRFK